MKMSNCRVCGNSFKYRKNKFYCCAKCKYEGWKHSLETKSCIYCGEHAITIDHIPPKSVRDFISSDTVLSKKYPFIEVDACHECNNLLGARPFWTVESRKEFIKKALYKKYKKCLTYRSWTEYQLEEVDYALRTAILNGMMQAARLKRRLAW